MERVWLKVWGPYACFTRPELKTEYVSYDVMTPAAAGGILSSIYTKPLEMGWVIDAVYILNPIRRINMLVNEVKSKASHKRKTIDINDDRTQRHRSFLRDVAYIIEAHIIVHDHNPKKHYEMFRRRVSKGQCYRRPCLGIREYAAMFELSSREEAGDLALDKNCDFGLMLHHMEYTKAAKQGKKLGEGQVRLSHDNMIYDVRPTFFHAISTAGRVDTTTRIYR